MTNIPISSIHNNTSFIHVALDSLNFSGNLRKLKSLPGMFLPQFLHLGTGFHIFHPKIRQDICPIYVLFWDTSFSLSLLFFLFFSFFLFWGGGGSSERYNVTLFTILFTFTYSLFTRPCFLQYEGLFIYPDEVKRQELEQNI